MKLKSVYLTAATLMIGLTAACSNSPSPVPAQTPVPKTTAVPTATAPVANATMVLASTSALTLSPAPSSTPTVTPAPTEPTVLYGVSLSPRSYTQDDFLGFFDLVKQAGGTLRWAGDWAELGAPSGGVSTVSALKGQLGYIPVYEVNVFRQSPTQLLRPLTADQIDKYVGAAKEFAAKEQPAYFGMGIEINILHEEMPDEFEKFVTLFDRAAEAIKEVSPETKIYTTFQLERMKGLHGGLWGGVDEPSTATWELMDQFPKADLFAFTTYPTLNYHDPADIPADYYAEIIDHVHGKPVAFTEIGWPAEMSITGWESDDIEQAAFVKRFFELTTTVEPVIVTWSFMFDFPPETLPVPFQSMAFIRHDNTERPAFAEWLVEIATVR